MAEIHGLADVMIEKSLDAKVDDWPESGLKGMASRWLTK